jgi:hypothetical protein
MHVGKKSTFVNRDVTLWEARTFGTVGHRADRATP